MCKNYVLMRDVICRYHPEFKKSKDLQRYGLTYPDIFNCERLVEEALAAIGGYKFVDEAGRDFDCPYNSDSKTTTVASYDRQVQIGSIENKIGSLRVTIYNPFLQSLAFMYIPKKDWTALKTACYGKNFHKERLRFTWNDVSNHYNGFHKFLVKDFKALATACG